MSQISNAILVRNRYRRLYRLASALEGAGPALKIAAALAGFGLPASSAVFFAQPSHAGHVLGWSLLGAGVMLGLAGYGAGLLLPVLGQALRSNADTAISASPVISAEMKSLLISRAVQRANRGPYPFDSGAVGAASAMAAVRRSLQARQLPATTEPAA